MFETYDIKLKQGSYWVTEIILKDDNGSIINLTDYTAKMQIRKEKDMSALLYDELTEINSRLEIVGIDGKIKIFFPDDISTAYTWSIGYYDLEITDNNTNKIYRVLQGRVLIDKNVTVNV